MKLCFILDFFSYYGQYSIKSLLTTSFRPKKTNANSIFAVLFCTNFKWSPNKKPKQKNRD